MFAPILLAGLIAAGLDPSAADPTHDLSSIERVIAKEPAYKGKPRYCLLVFGLFGLDTCFCSIRTLLGLTRQPSAFAFLSFVFCSKDSFAQRSATLLLILEIPAWRGEAWLW